jgi:hypothetical protein
MLISCPHSPQRDPVTLNEAHRMPYAIGRAHQSSSARRCNPLHGPGGAAAERARCSDWSVIGSLPSQQFGPMFLHDLQQPSVLDLPEGLIGLVLNQESEVRQ